MQIRALKDPNSGNAADRLRVASKLTDPEYATAAAFVISKNGTDFMLWSAFKHGTYLPYKGKDFMLVPGHPSADLWDTEFTTTALLGQWPVDGVLVNNNVHNAAEAGAQTMYASSPGKWQVVANHSKPDARPGSIKSYPDTQRNFTDRPIDSFTEIVAEYSMTNPPVGEWNAAFDIWINAIGSKSTAEVMVWTDHRYNGVIPPANAIQSTTVDIDGQQYNAWWRRNGNGGNYIALAMNPMHAAGRVDLLKIFRWLVEAGWLKGTDKVSAIEYGVEIANTAGGPQTFRLNSYTLTAQ